MNTPTIEFQALHLPLKARAALAEQLIASLDEPSEAELEAMWLDAAQERAAQLDANPDLGVPVETVLSKLKAKLAALPA
jgi:putative addiction module component (TIGR02574 family)